MTDHTLSNIFSNDYFQSLLDDYIAQFEQLEQQRKEECKNCTYFPMTISNVFWKSK